MYLSCSLHVFGLLSRQMKDVCPTAKIRTVYESPRSCSLLTVCFNTGVFEYVVKGVLLLPFFFDDICIFYILYTKNLILMKILTKRTHCLHLLQKVKKTIVLLFLLQFSSIYEEENDFHISLVILSFDNLFL